MTQKKYTIGNFIVDLILTGLTGGLWLAFKILRAIFTK
jgi:hypothetical protein